MPNHEAGKAFESHLQAHIVKILGTGINTNLDDIVLGGATIEWIGNEVSCGVGMQKIDVMLSTIQNEQRMLIPIELKAVEADETNLIQIKRYIDWIEQYYIPNHQGDIQPILAALRITEKKSVSYQQLTDSINTFNEESQNRFAKLKYVEFYLDAGNLSFE